MQSRDHDDSVNGGSIFSIAVLEHAKIDGERLLSQYLMDGPFILSCHSVLPPIY